MLQFYLQLIDTAAEQEKFRQLYDRYHRLLHWEAHRILEDDHLAEDAVQEAFLRIIKNFHKIGEISCPQTRRFVVIIVRNAARNLFAKENRHRRMENIDAMTGDAGESNSANYIWESLSAGFDETSDAVLRSEILQTVRALPD